MKNIDVKHGSEGSRHDPYSYTELTWRQDGKVVVLHQGLANWCTVNGEKFEGRGDNYESYPVEVFEKETGVKVADIYHWLYEGESEELVCEKCGPEAGTESMNGHPGESFIVCSKCGNILHGHFNESAII